MDQVRSVFVRGKCACGKRYRIRNATAGVTVYCPNCRRPIPITGADLQAAAAEMRLVPVQRDSGEPLEAIPVDRGELILASEGSRPGLTGRTLLNHEEAMLASAQSSGITYSYTYEDMNPPVGGGGVLIEIEPRRREFLYDLLASFYFVGISHNALNVLLTAVTLWLLVSLQMLAGYRQLVLILLTPLYAVVGFYTMQFYWSVLRITAAGEDIIPWVPSGWSFWEDGLKPLIWIAAISVLCTFPSWLLWRGYLGFTVNSTVLVAILCAGWLFWPVAVMSVALGNSILFARPDWLLRCVIGIGPVYVVAWLAALVAVVGWMVSWRFSIVLMRIPVVGVALNLYFGYVLFRTLGLLFRHFRDRFPWRF